MALVQKGYYLVVLYRGKKTEQRMCMIKTSLEQQRCCNEISSCTERPINHEALMGRASIDLWNKL